MTRHLDYTCDSPKLKGGSAALSVIRCQKCKDDRTKSVSGWPRGTIKGAISKVPRWLTAADWRQSNYQYKLNRGNQLSYTSASASGQRHRRHIHRHHAPHGQCARRQSLGSSETPDRGLSADVWVLAISCRGTPWLQCRSLCDAPYHLWPPM